jgi:periplasmic copper chaperone A
MQACGRHGMGRMDGSTLTALRTPENALPVRKTQARSKFMTNGAKKAACYNLSAALILVLAQLAASPAPAKDYDVGSIHITQPWARATPKGASSGAAYMTVTNNGSAPDRMSCVSSDASRECQIHSMTMEGGVMKMRPVEGGLEIKPGETVTLKPSGFHVMLVNLKHPLTQAAQVKVTFKFEHAGTVDVECPVEAMGAPAPGAAGNGGGMMQGHGSMMQMDKH